MQTEHVVWADSADETVRMLVALHEQQAQDEDADLDDREELDALVDYRTKAFCSLGFEHPENHYIGTEVKRVMGRKMVALTSRRYNSSRTRLMNNVRKPAL